MIFASFSLVKTQVTVSPAASTIALAGELSREQTADFRSQPAGTFSETEYVPGFEVAGVVLLTVDQREAVAVVARVEA